MKLLAFLKNQRSNLQSFISGANFEVLTADLQTDYKTQLQSMDALIQSHSDDDSDPNLTPIVRLIESSQQSAQTLAIENSNLRVQMSSLKTSDQVQQEIDAKIQSGDLFRKEDHQNLLQSAVQTANQSAKDEAQRLFQQMVDAEKIVSGRREKLAQSKIPAPESDDGLRGDEAAWQARLGVAQTRHTQLLSAGLRPDAVALRTLLWSEESDYERLKPQFLDAIQAARVGGNNPGSPPQGDPFTSDDGAGGGAVTNRLV